MVIAIVSSVVATGRSINGDEMLRQVLPLREALLGKSPYLPAAGDIDQLPRGMDGNRVLKRP